MSVVIDIYNLIKDLMVEADKNNNNELYSNLIDIKRQVNELDEENQKLKKELEIRDRMQYDEGARSFILKDSPDIHYCAVCYGYGGKMIPMTNNNDRGFVCRVCDEIWFNKIPRK